MRALPVRMVLFAVFALCLSGLPRLSWGHGSVAESEEGCVIEFGFYSAHFNVFQPQTRRHTAFCEDLPDVTETIFALEYLHDSLRQVPLELRILHNTSSLGRFVRWDDLQAMGDLTAQTVYSLTVPPQPDGVLSVLFPFTEAGDFVGIISAPNLTGDEVYHAVFPFRVGQPWWQNRWLWALGLLCLAALWRALRSPGPSLQRSFA